MSENKEIQRLIDGMVAKKREQIDASIASVNGSSQFEKKLERLQISPKKRESFYAKVNLLKDAAHKLEAALASSEKSVNLTRNFFVITRAQNLLSHIDTITSYIGKSFENGIFRKTFENINNCVYSAIFSCVIAKSCVEDATVMEISLEKLKEYSEEICVLIGSLNSEFVEEESSDGSESSTIICGDLQRANSFSSLSSESIFVGEASTSERDGGYSSSYLSPQPSSSSTIYAQENDKSPSFLNFYVTYKLTKNSIQICKQEHKEQTNLWKEIDTDDTSYVSQHFIGVESDIIEYRIKKSREFLSGKPSFVTVSVPKSCSLLTGNEGLFQMNYLRISLNELKSGILFLESWLTNKQNNWNVDEFDKISSRFAFFVFSFRRSNECLRLSQKPAYNLKKHFIEIDGLQIMSWLHECIVFREINDPTNLNQSISLARKFLEKLDHLNFMLPALLPKLESSTTQKKIMYF